MIDIEGEQTTARVFLEDDQLESSCRSQIQTLVDHEAFTEPVRIMSDAHPGRGSVIGFTMALGDRVIPNVIGVDIGCGMFAANLGPELAVEGEALDDAVRSRVPMGAGKSGLNAPERSHFHVKNDFPFAETTATLEGFVDALDSEHAELRQFLEHGGYDIDYFKELCRRVGTDVNYAINSIGTLGGGNHFIEVAQHTETGHYWVVVHSGSRNLGARIAQHWQERATELTTARALARDSDQTLSSPDSKPISKYLRDNGSIIRDHVRRDFSGGDIEDAFEELAALGADEDRNTTLDYLEGEEADGYFIDMIFAQQYASVSRRMMAEEVADVLGVEFRDEIESVHNFIDFRDQIIRKGATRSYDGERVIVPFNMKDGTLIVEGKSNPEWNYSVCHGAGRVMSRTRARNTFDQDAVSAALSDAGVHTSTVPVDEAPGAYKNSELIEAAIEPTAEVVGRLEVVHNFKAS